MGKTNKLTKKMYTEELYKLQVELCKLQEWVTSTGKRAIIIFEGRDAAGKGGVIKALTEQVSPRIFQINALPAPSEREKTQMYLQRYIARFPAAGEIAIFDRSWYNRAGVERVMGFCTETEHQRFMSTVPGFEKTIIDNGITLLKYWFDVNADEQSKRFEARMTDPRKHWKLSPMDLEGQSRWYDYSRARDEMLLTTDTTWAPWHVVNSDNKKRARLNCLTHLISQFPYESTPYEKPQLLPRQESGGYVDPDYEYKHIPEKF